MNFRVALATTLVLLAGPAFAQQCLPDGRKTPEQEASYRDAIRVARWLNTAQANQPGARNGRFLSASELEAAKQKRPTGNALLDQMKLTGGDQILPGMTMQLALTESGYLFTIKNVDACVPVVISDQAGLIYNATPLQ